MISKWRWVIGHLAREIWVRSTLFALLGVVTALVAAKLDPIVPGEISTSIGSDAVFEVLNILASSMLAVTTFSLSVLVTSLGAATNNVTPRATRLLVADSTSQNVMSAFLGTFMFSLVGIIALNTGYYSERGRVILFIVTIGVVGVVVFTMLRWIDHLFVLGRVSDTTARVERAAADAIATHVGTPYLGGGYLTEAMVEEARGCETIFPDATGHIRFVDMQALQAAASEFSRNIYLLAVPGIFVYPARPLAIAVPDKSETGEPMDEDEKSERLHTLKKAIRNAITIGDERSFEQDPRFGLCVLAEIAARALSPAMNDPGTAIDVIHRGVRLLQPMVAPGRERDSDEIVCSNVYVPSIPAADIMRDFFSPIARDGAAIAEVQIRLQKALLALSKMGDAEARQAAKIQSHEAMEIAEASLQLASDKDRMRAIVRQIDELAA
ncbi:MAG: DUF2254 domain-containing protein [Hyphomicrobiales bacterium]|nr:DUF2254 domain-containing protein [Hyphomicrobiales bacterium]